MLAAVTWSLVAVVVLGLLFDYVNGFHDSANAIATVVSTRALSPQQAVLMAAVLNVGGAFLFEGVAKTIGQGLIEASVINNQMIIITALLGAILWNILTWWWGLPSSSSHALVGGLVGSVLIYRGFDAVIWHGVFTKVVLPGIVSPLLGLAAGFTVMLILLWTFRNADPSRIHPRFRRCQIVSASLMALAHGSNDAQKVMGIITLSLVAGGLQPTFAIPLWVKLACATAMGLGTAAGGRRIIRTMGNKITKLQPVTGFAADIASSTVLFTTAWLGMPVSTTHVISAAIMGVGSTQRLSAVRWGVARNILAAWVMTLPASGLAAGFIFLLFRPFVH